MNSPRWCEVTCHCSPDAADMVSDFLVELSGTGVCTDNRQVDTFSVDDLDSPATTVITAYFPADDSLVAHVDNVTAYLRNLAIAHPSWSLPAPTVTEIRDEEWAHAWKVHFKPFRVGTRLLVKPTWEEFSPSADDLVLEIDPGMAFGTGSHETTKLCLETIEGICQQTNAFAPLTYPAPASCLDVGTGSGILGIGAVKLGIGQAVGIDIDPEAITVAAENAELNGVAALFAVSTTPLREISGCFDVVVANILAEELVKMAPLLAERTAPGGFLILSGILTEREPLVIAGFAPLGLSLLPPSREGEWSCLVYQQGL